MNIASIGGLLRASPRKRVAFAGLLVAGALLSGCSHVPKYTPATMTSLPAQRTPHCIGRYLIDLPSSFDLKTGGWGDIELYYGLDKNFQRVYATVKQGRYRFHRRGASCISS